MTRMEKWQSYRLEIDQSSKIGQIIANQSQMIHKYKKEIDKVNPAILQNVKEVDLNMHKGVSEVIVSQKQIPSQITKMFKDLNKAKTANNKNNISTILFNLKNNNILNDKQRVREDWLNTNQDYVELSNYIKQANLNLNRNTEFEKDLQKKFEHLSTTKTETQIQEIVPLTQKNQKNIGHHVFVIAIAIASVFFLLILVLLFVKLFGGN